MVCHPFYIRMWFIWLSWAQNDLHRIGIIPVTNAVWSLNACKYPFKKINIYVFLEIHFNGSNNYWRISNTGVWYIQLPLLVCYGNKKRSYLVWDLMICIIGVKDICMLMYDNYSCILALMRWTATRVTGHWWLAQDAQLYIMCVCVSCSQFNISFRIIWISTNTQSPWRTHHTYI